MQDILDICIETIISLLGAGLLIFIEYVVSLILQRIFFQLTLRSDMKISPKGRLS